MDSREQKERQVVEIDQFELVPIYIRCQVRYGCMYGDFDHSFFTGTTDQSVISVLEIGDTTV